MKLGSRHSRPPRVGRYRKSYPPRSTEETLKHSESVERLQWTKTKPTEPGHYYRTTEWARVVAVKVVDTVNGLIGDIGDGSKLIEKFSPYFFWIGPMPEPPDEANRVKHERQRLADQT